MGVSIQLVFPCTPPWYETKHGIDTPAYYGMEGDPAGLARIDKLFGVDMYTTTFTTAPLPFGAFPSLHAGNATIEALFLSYCFPKLRPLFFLYVAWIWWATMYLSHHYAVDLVGGSFLAAICYYYARAYFLPRQQPDKTNRWEYEYIECGENRPQEDALPVYNLGNYWDRRRGSSDEWTIGSSSAFSSSSSSASGTLSPVSAHDERGWESDTSHTPRSTHCSQEDSDLREVVVRQSSRQMWTLLGGQLLNKIVDFSKFRISTALNTRHLLIIIPIFHHSLFSITSRATFAAVHNTHEIYPGKEGVHSLYRASPFGGFDFGQTATKHPGLELLLVSFSILRVMCSLHIGLFSDRGIYQTYIQNSAQSCQLHCKLLKLHLH